jgi:hypothetical protein
MMMMNKEKRERERERSSEWSKEQVQTERLYGLTE